jgi:sec-independent protein translocase protein TatA
VGIENPVHLMFIAIVALLVLGPKRLPDLARALGHGIREFREAVGQHTESPHMPPAEDVPSAPHMPPAEDVPSVPHITPAPDVPPAQHAPPDPVDPTEPVRSGDAPDSRPL